ncbi:hypothetical protein O181_026147 [Austropuccinia psidii MF-1]|uniref:Uncharacterized protein n=1 Tax=Austropuccinia psidii MF-1 TaxID=1389203 RepID=A0A9Q3H0I8_9BASI|nr:hypothetical protein [Austropuccinia psidii MF-1]
MPILLQGQSATSADFNNPIGICGEDLDRWQLSQCKMYDQSSSQMPGQEKVRRRVARGEHRANHDARGSHNYHARLMYHLDQIDGKDDVSGLFAQHLGL